MHTEFFESNGYQVFIDFLDSSKSEELLALINEFQETHDLPEIHRPMKKRSLRYFVIDGDQINEHLKDIWDLYQDKVQNLVNDLTGPKHVPLKNTRVGVNVNIMPPGRSEYRWHYDRVAITVILYLNEVEGGETVLFPNYRLLLKNKKRIGLQKFLDKCLEFEIIRSLFGKKIVVSPSPGKLVVMQGNTCWHSVRSVEGDSERIAIILAYDLADAEFPVEKELDSYLYTREKQSSSDPNYGN